MTERVPVTVLTGFLGAGKTTLLNRILSDDHGRRYAVIVNEFGEIGIDNDLILSSSEELLEMNNGCVCCTVRGDLIRSLHGLLSKDRQFDAIVVETTGLADPGPVAQTFFVDSFLQSRTSLDSVTAVVDAKHILQTLARSREAVEQIAFADQIVLNKTELVEAEELREIEARLRRMNPYTPIHRAVRANVALDRVLGRGGFDLERIISLEPDFLGKGEGPAGQRSSTVGGEFSHHAPESEIESLSLTSALAMDGEKVSHWLTELFATRGQDILRAKGIIQVAGEERRLVFQAVHMVLEGDFQRPWKAGEKRLSKLVFIGRRLDRRALEKAFEACAAGTPNLNSTPIEE